MLNRILLWVLLGAPALLCAQTTLYPVRIDHKWGFIIRKPRPPYHKMKIEPVYELLGDVNLPWNTPEGTGDKSPYRLCEAGGRSGLLDEHYQAVLPPRYQRIRPLTMRYFAVETDSLFTVVDTAGRTCVQGRWSDICAIGAAPDGETDYFMVKRGTHWGIYHKNDGLLVAPKFSAIEAVEGSADHFKIKDRPDAAGWGLADRTGRILIACKYEHIMVLGPDFYALQTVETTTSRTPGAPINEIVIWQLFLNGKMHPYSFSQVRRLAFPWVLTQSRETPRQLWNVQTRSPALEPKGIRRYGQLDDRYILYEADNRSFGVLDTALRIVVPAEFDSITTSGQPGIYRVLDERKWGLLKPGVEKPLTIPCVYKRVWPFEQGLALVQYNERFGAIDAKFAFVAKPDYAEVELQGDSVLALRTTDNKLLELDRRTGRLREYGTVSFLNANQLQVSGDGQRDPVIADETDADDAPRRSSPATSSDSLDHTAGPPRRALGSGELILEIRPARPVQLPSFGTTPIKPATLCRADGQVIAGAPKMLGCRPFVEGVAVTAFVDLSGRFGLIDRAGRQLTDGEGQPLRYTYIGSFHLGRARVCLGGRLEYSRPDEMPPTALTRVGGLIRALGLSWHSKQAPNWGNRYLFVASDTSNQPRWGFIDTQGRLVVGLRYDWVSTFHQFDSLALVARYNNKVASGSKNQLDFGAIDRSGKIAIPIQYTSITRRPNGYRIEVDSTPIFYFNQKGYQIFTNAYRPKGFREGLCPLRNSTQLYGVIDTAGALVIPYRYTALRDYSDGLAAAFNGEIWTFVDRRGQTVFTTAVTEAHGNTLGDFSQGRCAFMEKPNTGGPGVWGYYDRRGQVVIPPRFLQGAGMRSAPPFVAGAAAVRVRDSLTRQLHWAIIDTTGAYLMAPSPAFEQIDTFNSWGTAVAQLRPSKKFVLIDRSGKTISASFDRLEKFVNGFARVRNGAHWGLIDPAGKVRVPVTQAEVDQVSEGLVAVRPVNPGPWVYLDTLGRTSTVKGRFQRAGRFLGGSAMVDEGTIINRSGERRTVPNQKTVSFSEAIFGIQLPSQRFFYADGDGTNYFKRQFAVIRPFYRGIAQVKVDEKPTWGALNRRGLFIIAPKYRNIHQQPDGNFVINSQRYSGLLDCDRNILLPPMYDRIVPLSNGVLRVECGEEIGYFDSYNHRWFWPMQK